MTYPHTLEEWLQILELRHPTEIDLGLDRVQVVFDRLDLPLPYSVVIGGTNGKGTTLQAICNGLSKLGLQVAAYTSPHIYRFNERICINGTEASDADIVDAFERVEQSRADVSLTYFEFTTLAAFVLFSRRFVERKLDVMVCEVGLGGRLDAVNVLDPSLSIVTGVGLDHQDWLGDTVEAIAYEKAGILRKERLGLVGETFPAEVLSALRGQGFSLMSYGKEFGCALIEEGSTPAVRQFKQAGEILCCTLSSTYGLPLNNLALAMQACVLVSESNQNWRMSQSDIDSLALEISDTRVSGRLEKVSDSPVTIVDVAHNPQAAANLARFTLEHYKDKKRFAVFSCLKDKDIREIVAAEQGVFDTWFISELQGERAMPKTNIESALNDAQQVWESFETLEDAYNSACKAANCVDGMVVVFGSFHVLETLNLRSLSNG